MRLLMVEDDAEIAALVARNLEHAGFAVDRVATIAEAEAASAAHAYDVALLDRRLPDGDGLELLRWWRASGRTMPVIVATARDKVDDRIDGLDHGADDYLVKPYVLDELLARIRAVLRRPGGALGTVLEVGNLRLDTSARRVTVDGTCVELPRREFAILELLLRRADTVVDRRTLDLAVYHGDRETQSNAMEANVSRLRRRLAAAAATVDIHTVRGIGYLLRCLPPGP